MDIGIIVPETAERCQCVVSYKRNVSELIILLCIVVVFLGCVRLLVY